MGEREVPLLDRFEVVGVRVEEEAALEAAQLRGGGSDVIPVPDPSAHPMVGQ
jgi:hypothetical protein